MVVELRWGEQVRYTHTDAKGRFLFDGLPKAEYSLTAYAGSYPSQVEPVAGPGRMALPEKACVHQILFIPKPRQ